MDCHPRRVKEMIVGLGDVKVLAADDAGGLLLSRCRLVISGEAPLELAGAPITC